MLGLRSVHLRTIWSRQLSSRRSFQGAIRADEQKQNRDLNAKLTHAQTSSSSEGEPESKATAAKMVEAELRDSLSTAQSRESACASGGYCR